MDFRDNNIYGGFYSPPNGTDYYFDSKAREDEP